jgi:hypothetical protein
VSFYICNMVALIKLFRRISWDYVGISASTLCAIHCLVFPFLVMLGSVSGLGMAYNHKYENVIIIASAIIGFTSLVPSYLNHHRRLNAITAFLVGFSLIIFGRFNVPVFLETVLTTLGASVVALSHLINLRLCRTQHADSEA